MAKIDVTKIEGYEAMSAEDKLKALEAYEFDAPEPPKGNEDVDKYKKLLDKANAEAKQYKDQLRAKQTEDEKAAAEREEADKAIQSELAELRRDKTIATYKSQYLALGYDEELAKSTAEAMADNKTDVVFANQKKFIENHDKKAEADRLKNMPKPPAGKVPENNNPTPEEFKKMTYAEMVAVKQNNPELYKKLIGGK